MISLFACLLAVSVAVVVAVAVAVLVLLVVLVAVQRILEGKRRCINYHLSWKCCLYRAFLIQKFRISAGW